MTAMPAMEHLETASKQGVPVEVEMDIEASADEVEAVRAAFSDASLDATVEARLETRGTDTSPGPSTLRSVRRSLGQGR